jgi:type IV pilus assembly protein PilY1
VVSGTSNLFNGTLNGLTTAWPTVFNGTLNNGSPYTTSITLSHSATDVSISGTVVTLTYTAQAPASPLIATNDTITTSGAGCGAKYTVTNVPLALGTAGTLTYTSPGGGGGTSKNCNATVKHVTTPVVAIPSISSDNTTVTVKLSTAHGLVSGDVLTIANGSGTCDAGYRATSVTATVLDATTFTYPAAALLGTASNTSCKITKAVVTQPGAPGISISGNVVTVQLTAHGLSSGDVIQVTGGSCGTAFKTITTPGVAVTVTGFNTFTYSSATPAGTTGLVCSIDKVTGMASVSTAFTSSNTQNGNAYEYVIVPVEFCDSAYLTNCVASSAPTGVYTYPAPVRFCTTDAIAALPPGDAGAQVSGSTLACQGKFSDVNTINSTTVPTYTSVRYGLFYRVDIVSSRATYGNEVLNTTINVNGTSIVFNNVTVIDRSQRNYSYTSGGTTYTDCAAAPNCTYAEEMTNFANHYAYYRTRIQMMKTAVGSAFNSPTMSGSQALYRLGFNTINFSSGDYLAMGNIDYPVTSTGQKASFYSKLYGITPGSYTPLREAVARAGRYFAGEHGLSNEMTDDPMQYSCQQNYLLITTDGYWNGPASGWGNDTSGSTVYDLNGTKLTNTDNVDSGLTARSLGVYDGGISFSPTLADVTEYYYQTDLRTKTLNNCTDALGNAWSLCANITSTDDALNLNNVPTSTADTAKWQHMVTFSLGLADGLMLYRPDYAKATTGDFSHIKSGASGCSFSGSGTCNWPLPVHDTQTALDDLWHAAVNGRGAYFNARDPSSLAAGLSAALAGMQAQTGAASASATSSPNISKTDRAIYSSTYRTQLWDGEVVAQLLDPMTATVPPATLTALPAISAISLSSATVTVTLNSHGLLTGDWIQVANTTTGTCDAGFSTGGQSVPVTVTDANHFTYTSTNSSGAVANTSCLISKAGIVWSAQAKLDYKVQQAILSGTDPEIRARYIITLDQAQAHPLTVTGPNGVKELRYSKLTATEAGYFDNQCLSGTTVILSQCVTGNLTTVQISSANSGTNLVPYLRGQTAMELTTPNPVYRPRQHYLGDIVNAKPNYVRAPQYSYNDSLPNDTSNSNSYTTFIANNLSRQAALYVAANDGMLHAFDAGGCTGSGSSIVCNPGTGSEIWAYVPRMVMPKLHQLADINYETKHNYFVDGSPEVMDIFVNAANTTSSGLSTGWHTILVGGLSGGGMGFYALDITNPQIPVALWETCADKDTAGNSMCSNSDADMGYSYGNPVITKRSSDGRWVVLVTSGYNNITAGNGAGYLYVLDALSGVILQKIPTGSGSTSSPSGLAKISAFVDSSNTDNTTRFVYGGDLNGDVWRFDLGAVGSTPAVYPTLSTAATHFAKLKDSLGNGQPITTRPELGNVSTTSGSINSLTATGKPVVYIGTGQYVFTNDACVKTQQSLYALEDDFNTQPYFNNPRTYTSSIVQQTISATTGASTSNLAVSWKANGGTNDGWFMDFPTTGERVNIDPVLALGTLFVVTNVPLCSGSTSCTNGGTSYLYQFDYMNGNGIDGTVRTLIGNYLTVGFEVVRTLSGSLKVIEKGSNNSEKTDTGKNKGHSVVRNVSWRELVK